MKKVLLSQPLRPLNICLVDIDSILHKPLSLEKDILTIENIYNTGINTIELYNITGKQLFKKVSADKFIQIPFDSYSKGLYFIKILTDNEIYIKRIMVE